MANQRSQTRITDEASAVAYLRSVGELPETVQRNGAMCVESHCYRCGGSGRYHWATAYGPRSGTCFQCSGDGDHKYTPIIKYARNVKNRLRRAKHGRTAAQIQCDWEKNENEAQGFGRFSDHELSTRYNLLREERWQAAQDILRRERKARSQYVGDVGKRVEIEVRIERIIVIKSRFGSKLLYIFHDAQENRLCWFCSGDSLRTQAGGAWDDKCDEGHYLRIRGTIKTHEAYDGERQTVLSRVKTL